MRKREGEERGREEREEERGKEERERGRTHRPCRFEDVSERVQPSSAASCPQWWPHCPLPSSPPPPPACLHWPPSIDSCSAECRTYRSEPSPASSPGHTGCTSFWCLTLGQLSPPLAPSLSAVAKRREGEREGGREENKECVRERENERKCERAGGRVKRGREEGREEWKAGRRGSG